MALKRTTPPSIEPVTLAEVKINLRIDPDDTSQDATLNGLIKGAREWCEGFQNRAYITQQFELALDRFPLFNHHFPFHSHFRHHHSHLHEIEAIKLPRPPLQQVLSLSYIDNLNVTTIWDTANYIVDDFSEPARIVRAHGVCWPNVCLAPVNGVRVTYKSGYGDTADLVPQLVKNAIKLLVAIRYEDPDSGDDASYPAVESLLWMDRVVPV